VEDIKVVVSQKISILYGFSRYNQIMVHLDDQEKTTFTMPWGTLMYAKMPFRFMNVGETLQRSMDIAFAYEKYKFNVIYLDDMTLFSDSDDQHLKHLRRVFQKKVWHLIESKNVKFLNARRKTLKVKERIQEVGKS
jgi:hypothetical protein